MPLEDLKNKADLDECTDAISSSIICKARFVRNLNFENYADLIKKKSNIRELSAVSEFGRLSQDNHMVTDSSSYIANSHYKKS